MHGHVPLEVAAVSLGLFPLPRRVAEGIPLSARSTPASPAPGPLRKPASRAVTANTGPACGPSLPANALKGHHSCTPGGMARVTEEHGPPFHTHTTGSNTSSGQMENGFSLKTKLATWPELRNRPHSSQRGFRVWPS